MLTCLVPVLLTFYIQVVLKLKKNNSGAKRLTDGTGSFIKVPQNMHNLLHQYTERSSTGLILEVVKMYQISRI